MNQPDPNIDELLNSFIDGELTAGKLAEVERLIAHDAQIARRLQQFQKTRMLINCLPRAEAPRQMAEQIKASLATERRLAEQRLYFGKREGTRQLLLRNCLAAAAMIALVAVLAGVVYTIIIPQTISERPAEGVVAIGPTPSVTTGARFSGRLELRTGVLVTVDAFINRAIEDNGLSDCVNKTVQPNRRLYSLSCGRQGLSSLLADLENVWQKFDSATLFVDTEQFGAPVVVESITAEQTAEIAAQDNAIKSIEVAKDFAILNNMAEVMPGKQILAAIGDRSVSLTSIPKPFLTGKQKTASRPDDKREVSLTIVLAGSE